MHGELHGGGRSTTATMPITVNHLSLDRIDPPTTGELQLDTPEMTAYPFKCPKYNASTRRGRPSTAPSTAAARRAPPPRAPRRLVVHGVDGARGAAAAVEPVADALLGRVSARSAAGARARTL